MIKYIIVGIIAIIVFVAFGVFLGKSLYELISKPDIILWFDDDTNQTWLEASEKPEKYKNGSRLICQAKHIRSEKGKK